MVYDGVECIKYLFLSHIKLMITVLLISVLSWCVISVFNRCGFISEFISESVWECVFVRVHGSVCVCVCM